MWTGLISRLAALTQLLGSSGNSAEEPVSKSWIDPYVDAVSRLIRPLAVFGVFALIIWAVVDPVSAGAFGKAISMWPENFWLAILIVLGGWFMSRSISDIRKPGGRGPSSSISVDVDVDTKTAEDKFEDVIDDVKSAPNAALLEWKNAAKRNRK